MRNEAIAFGNFIARNNLVGTHRPAFDDDDSEVEYGFSIAEWDKDGDFCPSGFITTNEAYGLFKALDENKLGDE